MTTPLRQKMMEDLQLHGLSGRTQELYVLAVQRTEEEFLQFQLENLPPVPVDFHTIKSANLGHHV